MNSNKDYLPIICPSCSRRLLYSRTDARKLGKIDFKCSCGHEETLRVADRPELASALYIVTLSDKSFDTRNVSKAVLDGSHKLLRLTFRDGEQMTVGIVDLQADVKTLESCGVHIGRGEKGQGSSF